MPVPHLLSGFIANGHLSQVSIQSHSSDDKGNNAMKLETVHRFEWAPLSQMKSVGSNNTSWDSDILISVEPCIVTKKALC
jgi:hypothetical protein